MMKNISVSKERLPWLLLSTGAMFLSAYSVVRWIGIVGAISGWTGLPQYEAQIPLLRASAKVWQGLAVALPFVAAWFLGLGRKHQLNQREVPEAASATYARDSRTSVSPISEYAFRLGLSIVGTLGFALCLFLLGTLLYKLGVHKSL
jgi:hypothetical protein